MSFLRFPACWPGRHDLITIREGDIFIAGTDPVDNLAGRRPLPGLPEDLAAATSLPAADVGPPHTGAVPVQVS